MNSPFLKSTTDSHKTYVEVKGHWKYLYRAVDSKGQTIEFILPANRDILVAKRFFKKTFCSPYNQSPRVVTVDKYPTYPPSLQQLKDEMVLPHETLIWQTKSLNNIVEQDHRFFKKITSLMLGFKWFQTTDCALNGIEAMHMLRKGQVDPEQSPVSSVAEFINHLFDLSA